MTQMLGMEEGLDTPLGSLMSAEVAAVDAYCDYKRAYDAGDDCGEQWAKYLECRKGVDSARVALGDAMLAILRTGK